MGVPAHLVTWYADDADGARIDAHVTASGVSVMEGSRAAVATSQARAFLDEQQQATYEFDLTWDPSLVEPDGFAALHVGSLGTVVEPGATTIRALVRTANERGVPVTYDPNVRPALSPDPVAVWRAVRRDASAATVVKLSQEDAAYLTPSASHDEVLDGLLAADLTRLVVLTCGAEGARLATQQRRVDVRAPAVEVVDTVGAGDAFMAGLLAGLHGRDVLDGVLLDQLNDDDLRSLGEEAVEVAAVTCSRRGADPPRRDELHGQRRGS